MFNAIATDSGPMLKSSGRCLLSVRL